MFLFFAGGGGGFGRFQVSGLWGFQGLGLRGCRALRKLAVLGISGWEVRVPKGSNEGKEGVWCFGGLGCPPKREARSPKT